MATKNKMAPAGIGNGDEVAIEDANTADDETIANEADTEVTAEENKVTTVVNEEVVFNSSREETCFPFLKLPPELRNIIYRYALVDPSNQNINFECHTLGFLCRQLTPPDLTSTNKLIRSEALPIFYFENKFDVDIPNLGYHRMHNRVWASFAKLFSIADQSNAMQNVIRLTGSCDTHWGATRKLSFKAYGGGPHGPDYATKSPRHRIGNDNLDWNDEKAVKRACGKVLIGQCSDLKKLKRRVLYIRTVDALIMMAKKCPRAFLWVELHAKGLGEI